MSTKIRSTPSSRHAAVVEGRCVKLSIDGVGVIALSSVFVEIGAYRTPWRVLFEEQTCYVVKGVDAAE